MVTHFTREQLNEYTNLLREEIDDKWERIVDLEASEAEADRICKPLYDAITNLHEAATRKEA